MTEAITPTSQSHHTTPPSPQTGSVTLLGPQTDYAEIGQVLNDLDVDGTVALITTGWQENEREDDALVAQIGRPTHNLALHARSERIYAEDPDYARASSKRQRKLRHVQRFYRVRLDAIDDAARAIAVRHVDPAFQQEQLAISVAQFQHIDTVHLEHCKTIWREFEDAWPASQRPVLMKERDEIAARMDEAAAVVISGGHVSALLNRLRLFDVLSTLGTKPIIAWSAGAMVLADRIVLFHDRPPFGKNLAQMLDVGLGVAPGVVVLPDTKHRMRADDHDSIARFAQRMAPARCLGMNPGAKLVFQSGGVLVSGRADLVTRDGQVREGWQP